MTRVKPMLGAAPGSNGLGDEAATAGLGFALLVVGVPLVLWMMDQQTKRAIRERR